MPGQDQTGPMGIGSMTGRGAGNCRGNKQPVYSGNDGFGRGAGRGGGRGMGCGLGFRTAAPVVLSREEQLESLKAQAAGLEEHIKALSAQILNLESE